MGNNNENRKDYEEIMMEEELLFDYWANHLCFCEEDLVDSTIKITSIEGVNDRTERP